MVITGEMVEAAARAYWQEIDKMTPGSMPWDSLPEAGRMEQSEHARAALVAALAARSSVCVDEDKCGKLFPTHGGTMACNLAAGHDGKHWWNDPVSSPPEPETDQ